MSDKHLSPQAWKAFAKGRNYKDAGLLKALEALDKFGEGQPDERLRALDEAEKQAEMLAKSAKGDKELAVYAGDLLKQAKAARKAAEVARATRDKQQAAQAQAKAKAAAQEDGGDDNDEDAPELLTTKLVSLLKDVRRGVPMHAMLAIGSAQSAVLLARKPISAPRRSVLVDYLGTASGVKFPTGQCLWEENAFTFVLATAALAPAKKLRAALKAQVGIAARVRVRGVDPGDVDDGDEDEDDVGKGKANGKGNDNAEAGMAAADGAVKVNPPAAPPSARTPAQGAADKTPGALTSPPAPAATAPVAVFKARLAALQPRIKEAASAGGPMAARVTAHSRELAALAQQKDFTQALAILNKLEALVAPRGSSQAHAESSQARAAQTPAAQTPAAKTPAAKTPAAPAAPQAPAASAGRGTLPLWQTAKDAAGEQLASLAGALRDTDHPLLIRIADQGLHALTRRLQVGLQAALVDYDAAAQEARAKAADKVKGQLADYRAFLKTDATLPLLERNPLGIEVDIRARLGRALDLIDARLKADRA